MIDLVIGQLLAAFNFVLSAALAVLSFRLYRHRHDQQHNWLLICFIFVSLYWAALYMYIFATGTHLFDTSNIGLYARPAMTVTLSLMVAEVIIRGD
jgi:hypothetical protein